ncbi:MAG: hypothetical protein IJA34_00475 [Lachnospiraceae bacterium]|nr:hypothetical protein [Lachnospiraceae bacterium]
MQKLKLYIEKWLNGEKVKGINISTYDIRLLVDIYNAIVKNQKPEFINGNVKQILDKCNIETVECGIGWKVE